MKKAFTLIEVLIVITIISLLSVMLIPYYGNLLQRVQLSRAPEEVAALIQEARTLSTSGYKPDVADEVSVVGVYFQKGESTLYLFSRPFSDPTTSTVTSTKIFDPSESSIKEVSIGNVVVQKISENDTTERDEGVIVFFPPFGDSLVDDNDNGTLDYTKKLTIEVGFGDGSTPGIKEVISFYSPTNRIVYEE